LCNQITLAIDCFDDEEDIHTLRNNVSIILEQYISIYGFMWGYAYNVELIKIFDADLSIQEFGIATMPGLVPGNEGTGPADGAFDADLRVRVFGIDTMPGLVPGNEGTDPADAASVVYRLCEGEDGSFLGRCLADFGMAMKHPKDTAFYCHRAIECIRDSVGSAKGQRDSARKWAAMHQVLDTTKDELAFITEASKAARHGNPKPITSAERNYMLHTTREIIRRFINWRLGQEESELRL